MARIPESALLQHACRCAEVPRHNVQSRTHGDGRCDLHGSRRVTSRPTGRASTDLSAARRMARLLARLPVRTPLCLYGTTWAVAVRRLRHDASEPSAGDGYYVVVSMVATGAGVLPLSLLVRPGCSRSSASGATIERGDIQATGVARADKPGCSPSLREHNGRSRCPWSSSPRRAACVHIAVGAPGCIRATAALTECAHGKALRSGNGRARHRGRRQAHTVANGGCRAPGTMYKEGVQRAPCL